MEHKLFKPKGFEEGKHAVVGDCNGITMNQRWEHETPLFTTAILGHVKSNEKILDYGCGVGRLAKEVLKQNSACHVIGTDDSEDMLKESVQYVESDRYKALLPRELKGNQFDLAYCVYVLQHVPAIKIRDILSRIHYYLKDEGTFVYCSSDYRMCIRYDQPGFFDDRFLGVDLQEEISRLFVKQGPLFGDATLDSHPILNKMIRTGLKHPAIVYKKKRLSVPYFDATADVSPTEYNMEGASKTETAVEPKSYKVPEHKQNLLLVNRLAPGDVLVMTNALRDLHLAHPGKYETEIRTACQEIFENNPYNTKLDYNNAEYEIINKELSKGDKDGHTMDMGDIKVIDMQYPLIHSSGKLGHHFSQGHRAFLEQILGVEIPQTSLQPEIYLTQDEKNWPSPALKAGVQGKYWIINAGSKGDFTLKQYPYYQEVVESLNLSGFSPSIIQIGQKAHNHIPLDGCIDMVGETNLRELFRLIYHAEGVITCVSLPMHIAAAFNKPCVVVAGAREGTRWELYPNHQFMYVNGCLPCASYDGCWRSKLEDCNNKLEGVPKCLTLIRPEEVARAVERYYEGGLLDYEKESCLSAIVGRG